MTHLTYLSSLPYLTYLTHLTYLPYSSRLTYPTYPALAARRRLRPLLDRAEPHHANQRAARIDDTPVRGEAPPRPRVRPVHACFRLDDGAAGRVRLDAKVHRRLGETRRVEANEVLGR